MDKMRIASLFNKTTLLKIPYFQRNYVWEKENWDRFLEDMIETSSLDKDYFLGTYIVKKDD